MSSKSKISASIFRSFSKPKTVICHFRKSVNHAEIVVNYFRGKYEWKDSIITLDKNEIDKFSKTQKLAIRNETYRDSASKIIYQIDKNHNIVDKEIKLFVNEYNVTE